MLIRPGTFNLTPEPFAIVFLTKVEVSRIDVTGIRVKAKYLPLFRTTVLGFGARLGACIFDMLLRVSTIPLLSRCVHVVPFSFPLKITH